MANNYKDLEIVKQFFQRAMEIFNFLVTDYGYQVMVPEIRDADYFQDASACITYQSYSITIEIDWYFAGAVINTSFIKNEGGKYPEKLSVIDEIGIGKVISIETLIGTITNGDLNELVLRDFHSVEFREVKKRGKLIEKNMEGILENLATLTKRYARDILDGDTSIFPLVQLYEKEHFWTVDDQGNLLRKD